MDRVENEAAATAAGKVAVRTEAAKIEDGVVVETATTTRRATTTDTFAESAARDAKYKAAEDACVAYAEVLKMQIIEHVVEVPQIQYQEVLIPMARPYDEHAEVQYANHIVQTVEENVEVPQVLYIDKAVDVLMVSESQAPMIQKVLKTVEALLVQYSDRIVDLLVMMQCRVPTTQTVQKAVEVPQVQILDRVDGIPKTVTQDKIPQRTAEQITDAPVPQVTGELVEDFNVFSQGLVQQRIVEPIVETPAVSLAEKIVDAPKAQTQEKRVHERIIQETDVPTPRVMEETIEVENLKPQSTLPDNKFASKPDGGCAVQAPECEELQRLRDEGLVSIHVINKLLMDSDSLELCKETLPSRSVMQVQSDKRRVVRRTHAVKRNSSRSPGMKLISMEIDICRAQDEDTSLATDINSDPTEQQQHCHSNQQQPTRQAMQQQLEGRERRRTRGRERRKERMKEEEIRKGEGRRKKGNLRSRRT